MRERRAKLAEAAVSGVHLGKEIDYAVDVGRVAEIDDFLKMKFEDM